jgi:hypothetical protein
MGLFSAKPKDELAQLERLAVKEFARAGRRGELVRDPDDPYNTQLVTEAGTFGFANLYIALLASAPRDRVRLARAHVASVGSAAGFEEPDLDDEEVVAGLRSRLISSDVRALIPLEYARPFAPGVVEVLCVDLPQTVQVLGDPVLTGRNLESLFDRGRSNLRFESFERTQMDPSLTFLEGPSLFVASQLMRPGFAADVIGPAPDGWVFAIPDRHTLAFHVMNGAESVAPITRLAEIMGSVDRDNRPGGLVSEHVFYTDGRDVQQITMMDADGAWGIHADGAFLDALNRSL